MKFRYVIVACLLVLALLQSAAARVQRDEKTDKLVKGATNALFELLPKNDFEAARAFMADELAAITSLEDWKKLRRQIALDAGSTPGYTAYQTTYYEKNTLLAAVDFYGQAARPDTYVCGFVVWEIVENKEIGFIRLEENVVSVAVFKSMPQQQAAQLLTNFRCPVPFIEKVLGVAVR